MMNIDMQILDTQAGRVASIHLQNIFNFHHLQPHTYLLSFSESYLVHPSQTSFKKVYWFGQNFRAPDESQTRTKQTRLTVDIKIADDISSEPQLADNEDIISHFRTELYSPATTWWNLGWKDQRKQKNPQPRGISEPTLEFNISGQALHTTKACHSTRREAGAGLSITKVHERMGARKNNERQKSAVPHLSLMNPGR